MKPRFRVGEVVTFQHGSMKEEPYQVRLLKWDADASWWTAQPLPDGEAVAVFEGELTRPTSHLFDHFKMFVNRLRDSAEYHKRAANALTTLADTLDTEWGTPDRSLTDARIAAWGLKEESKIVREVTEGVTRNTAAQIEELDALIREQE